MCAWCLFSDGLWLQFQQSPRNMHCPFSRAQVPFLGNKAKLNDEKTKVLCDSQPLGQSVSECRSCQIQVDAAKTGPSPGLYNCHHFQNRYDGPYPFSYVKQVTVISEFLETSPTPHLISLSKGWITAKSALWGFSKTQLHRLQRIQKASAKNHQDQTQGYHTCTEISAMATSQLSYSWVGLG